MKNKISITIRLFLLLTLLFPTILLAQSSPPGAITECGFESPPEIDRALNDQIQAYIERKHANVARGQMGSVTTIPVVWFIIENRGSTSTIPPAKILSQMEVMNTAFRDWGIRFSIARNFPNGSPLVPVAPSGNVTAIDQFDPVNPGIFWVNSAVYAGAWPGYTTIPHANMVNAITNLSDEDYLFLYVHQLDPNVLYGNAIGGGSSTLIGQGAAVRPDALGDINNCSNCVCFHDRGFTMVHEIGHYLGLAHLDEGPVCGGNTQTCYRVGDLVCDIGYQPARDQFFNCVTLPPAPSACPGFTYVSGNFMDYMADKFKFSFTPGQADRMDAFLHIRMPSMIDPEHVKAVGCRGNLFHVNGATGSPGNDGTSWGQAFPTLDDALAAATWGDEIWVANGVYTTPGNTPTESFDIPDGVALYGGFQGGETARNMRTLPSSTILSGAGFNYHVVTSGGGRFTVLDGFIINGGQAFGTGPNETEGAGIFLINSGMSIDNCIIDHNQSQNAGAGLFCIAGNPTLHRTHFMDNISDNGSPGMAITQGTDALVVDCNFRFNTSIGFGGGVSVDGSSMKLVNSIICYNIAPTFGSAVYNNNGFADIINCTIWGNGHSAICSDGGTLRVTNSIIFEHAADLEKINSPSVLIRYSCFQFSTTYSPLTNIIGNPRLINNEVEFGLPLTSSSPCIDMGLNAAITPFAVFDYFNGLENERVFDAANCQALAVNDPMTTPTIIVDMGASEFRNSCPRLGHVAQAEPQNAEVLQIKAIPNPSDGHFTLQLPTDSKGSLAIYDSKGMLVQTTDQIYGNTTQIDLSGASKGIYKVVFLGKKGMSFVNVAVQ